MATNAYGVVPLAARISKETQWGCRINEMNFGRLMKYGLVDRSPARKSFDCPTYFSKAFQIAFRFFYRALKIELRANVICEAS